MANYTVPNGHVGAYLKVLVEDAVDTVTFAIGSPGTPGWASVPRAVEVMGDGTAAIWVTVDGSEPEVAGSNCWLVPEGVGSTLELDVRDSDPTDAVVVKLLSEGTPTYSVARAA